MKTKTTRIAAAVLGLAMTLAGRTLGEEEPSLTVPRLDATITLDGQLLEPAWEQAAAYPVNDPHRGFNETLPDGCEGTIRLWRDHEALYLGFRIENPYLPLNLKAETRARDGGVYSDECIEVFFDTGGGSTGTRQLAANAVGSIYDGDFDSGPNSTWNGDWTVATTVVRGAWYSEWRIPYSDLGNAPSVRINCGRVGYGADDIRWMAAWKAPGWFKPWFRIDLTQ